MPVIAPLFGYYQHGDYTGLALWTVNVMPYLYLEYDGLTNRPEKLREEREDISRRTSTHYYFGMYMLLFGGISPFVDAFASHTLYLSSNYAPQPYLGNSVTAAYLSIISGGGGHFYRGNRGWGYLYFHLNNILVYLTINEFTREERYIESSDSYERSGINRKRAYTMAAILGLVKAIEVTHVLLIRDNIRNGKSTEEEFAFQPILFIDDESKLHFGAKFSYRY